jgi:polysaccharide export outer membrane protein
MMLGAALLAGCYTDPNPRDRVFPSAVSGAPTDAATAPTPSAPTPTTNLLQSAGGGISILRVGDPLTVSFTDIPVLTSGMHEQKVRIPEGGTITLPYNVRVMAAGKTVSQLEKDVRDAYVPAYFVNLTAIVNTEERFFYVDGEVKLPGRQGFSGELTVLRAIGTAGGFTDFANRRKIQLRRQNGQTFFINWNKAIDHPELDLPVYPNDHIFVKRTIWF